MSERAFASEQENDEHFRLLVESAKLYAIFGIDLEGRVTSWNKGAERMKGWTRDEIIGKHFRVLFTPDQQQRRVPEEEMRNALEHGSFIAEETRMKKDGTLFEAEVALHVLRAPDGTAIGFAKVTEDVSHRKALQRDADATRQFLQELVAIVGHDLRNPLNAIHMSAALLRGKLTGDEKAIRLVKRIEDSSGRAARIVGDLLDLSQTQLLGNIPITPGKVDLCAIVHQIVDEYQAAHPERHIELEAPDELIGQWDGQRLMQAVSNLVANALAHADPTRPVTVNVIDSGDHAGIGVHNWGTPIPKELQVDLFKPFKRGDSPDTKEKSLGLGLHIVEQIVAAHRGSIIVTSSSEKGTRFEISLPKQPPVSG